MYSKLECYSFYGFSELGAFLIMEACVGHLRKLSSPCAFNEMLVIKSYNAGLIADNFLQIYYVGLGYRATLRPKMEYL